MSSEADKILDHVGQYISADDVSVIVGNADRYAATTGERTDLLDSSYWQGMVTIRAVNYAKVVLADEKAASGTPMVAMLAALAKKFVDKLTKESDAAVAKLFGYNPVELPKGMVLRTLDDNIRNAEQSFGSKIVLQPGETFTIELSQIEIR